MAVILARGGSKGVARKNGRPVGGRPCIHWTITAAREADTVSRVVVSTDDAEITEAAQRAGAEVVARPAKLASDTATVDDAARHAVLAAEEGRAWTGPIVILYANVPLRPRGLIDRAVSLMVETGCDSVQSYSGVGKYHPWWMVRMDEAGRVAPWEGTVLNHGVYRRQDLPPALVPDGGVLVVSRRALFLQVPGVEPGPHAFFGRDRRGVVTAEGEVVDIDSERDLAAADAALRRLADDD